MVIGVTCMDADRYAGSVGQFDRPHTVGSRLDADIIM